MGNRSTDAGAEPLTTVIADAASHKQDFQQEIRGLSIDTRKKLLFLHPKTLTDSWPFPVDTLGEVIRVPSTVYPLLAATIREMPWEIEILDGYVTRISFADYKNKLSTPDVIAITVMTPLKALDTHLTIQLIRRLNPHAIIVLGGNHASAFPERWIECGADFVVIREGEAAFPELLRRIQKNENVADVPNLVYRQDGAVVRSGLSSGSVNLDDSPFPAWDLMNLKPYDAGLGGGGLSATLEISRGCPHRCDFCNINKYWDYSQRYKSVDRVIAEMDQLHHRGVRQIFFADDNFGHNHEHTTELFERVIDRRYGFRFGAFVRGDTFSRHPDFAALAARAGLRMCLMGIETLDPAWLKEHRKGVRTNDIAAMYKEIYRMLKENRIFLVGLFIDPLHREGHATSDQGVDGVVCDFHYSADLLAQKGSALFERRMNEGTVAKDMFYHDWNLPSCFEDRGVQANRKTFLDSLRRIDRHAVYNILKGSAMTKRFWGRNLGVSAERMVCTRLDDIKRYNIAKKNAMTPQERQEQIVSSVVNEAMVSELVQSEFWKAPLSLRNGIWTEGNDDHFGKDG